MLKILGRRTSGNVMLPLWAAEELGVEYQQVDIGGEFGGNDQPEYLAKRIRRSERLPSSRWTGS